ncbi:phosphate ABC transporter permease PstA [Geobacter pelophilus]|uniref:Phosphate transport system permease protein PstA n=2 Tax=Geoanaerobacter pelophilus TaxID=60036 RepID=A0AAW4LGB2_9BACT|nr:phosphate ABC transporter permease PstA [Geoanaerobacter pelophilus]
MNSFWKKGEPQVFVTAAALSVTLLLTVILVVVVMVNGLGFFWPSNVAKGELKDGTAILGEITAKEKGQVARLQFKVGNRDIYGQDFRWVDRSEIRTLTYPADSVVLERKEHGNFVGFLSKLSIEGLKLPDSKDLWLRFVSAHEQVVALAEQNRAIEQEMADLNYKAEQLRLKIAKLSFRDKAAHDAEVKALTAKRQEILNSFSTLSEKLIAQVAEQQRFTATFTEVGGNEKEISLANIVRSYRPNTMPVWSKAAYYLGKVWELLFDEPRESNTEGGLFPAIFGTVLMVLLMSFFSLPFGVIAAVYLREYAKDGMLVRLVRIAVNNLAGVPSIVYGVFGLGFFVYGLGAGIDNLFYAERLPTPTFGTGGILWASLTLALLTVPVVIVASEESLAAIPKGIREGSLALGATKFQTLSRILLPMATPGIMTGMILSMARAAGEVAPLMLVGVVKLAPTLPIDGRFPFFHVDRKFMHLGFHIYDVGFQSPNVEAAKPMVFVTTLLLLAIVIVASSAAIYLRSQMKKRYTTRTF